MYSRAQARALLSAIGRNIVQQILAYTCMRDEINKKRLLTWQQRGVHCAGLYLTRPSRLLAMVGSVTHDLDPVQGDFFGGPNGHCMSLLSLPAISCPICRDEHEIASCSAAVH